MEEYKQENLEVQNIEPTSDNVISTDSNEAESICDTLDSKLGHTQQSNESDDATAKKMDCEESSNQDNPVPAFNSSERDESSTDQDNLDIESNDASLLKASTGVKNSVPKPSSSGNQNDVHHIKWIEWSEGAVPIVTQNENGPCPLLAIFNVLLLSKRIVLSDGVEFISSGQILSRVAEIIWDAMPKDLADDERLNYEQNIADAIDVFPNLQTGLDVNVKFDTVRSFEYTPELAVFDILKIPLYHGWLVDPQDTAANEVLGNLSYNQAVEKAISHTTSENHDEIQLGLIVQQFLETTASQITYHGIVSLQNEMQPGSLAVLFRNNHFSTIHRHNDELFMLITDLGFVKESNVVWESLTSVQGDSQFVDGKFLNSPPKPLPSPAENVTQSTDLDYQLALSMQHVQQDLTPSQDDIPHSSEDFMLAQRLQQEEDRAAQQAQSRRPRPSGNTSRRQPRSRSSPKKDDSCIIL